MTEQATTDIIKRKWGFFEQFTLNEETTVKLLHVEKGRSISYQYHQFRSEQWHVIKGKCHITLGIWSNVFLPGSTIFIQPLEKHKLEALDDCIILEIARGKFDESDIVRL